MELTDRVPTYPNRRKITYEDGRVEYVTIEYADEPIEIGTPLNSKTLNDIARLSAIATGTYQGTQEAQTINVGFKPSVVFVMRKSNSAIENVKTFITDETNFSFASLNNSGFEIDDSYNLNESGKEYIYIAWRGLNE